MSFSALMLQPVGPKAGTPGIAVPDNTPPPPQREQAGSMWVMMAPIFVVMIVMFFMNRSQKKKEVETRSKLKKGDRVVSQSGILGELVEIGERLAEVKIAPGTKVQMLVSTISPYEPAAAKADDKQLKDLKDAKVAADKK